MSIFVDAVSVVVIALLASFVVYLFSLRRLPTAHGPDIPLYDRFGRERGSQPPAAAESPRPPEPDR